MAAAAGARLVGKFFGNTVSSAAGFGAGVALGPVVAPPVRLLRNTVNAAYPFEPPDVGSLALGVAQGQVDPAQAHKWARMHGVGQVAFDALIEIANTGPGVPTAFSLWRRGPLDLEGFKRAAKRQGLEDEWITALVKTKDILLNPSVIANAVQQGHMPNDGILPPPVGGSPPFTIPLTTIDLDPIKEAEGHGLTRERLQIETNLVGLPPGDIELLHMWNRDIIDEESVDAGIREGHRKTKWIPAVKELRWSILSPIQYVEARLRGWIGDPEMYAGGLKSGMRKPEMDLLFKTHGRPPSWHQIWIGLQRGGVYGGPTTGIDPAFLKGLQESNLRPEWYHMLWRSRYTYPSAFVLRALTQAGDLTQAETEDILGFIGWEPTLADKVSKKWAGATGATADQHVGKAQTQLWNRTHTSYLAGEISEADARASLAVAGVDAAGADGVLAVWNHERELERKQLAPAQVKKAYARAVANPATGAAWTRDDALAALIGRGYSPADANTFLDL